jgi:thiol-disulfide isomerase/thioredoxin
MTGVSEELKPDDVLDRRSRPRLRRHKPGVFAVVADWCGHCQSFKKRVAEAQSKSDLHFHYVKAGSTPKDHAFMQEMDISGIPAVYTVDPDGYITKWDGATDVGSLIQAGGAPHAGGQGDKRSVLPMPVVVLGLLIFALFLWTRSSGVRAGRA